MHTPLTFRQERFVFEYLKDQNASAAAARAGYTAKDLASAGSELMKNPAIQDRVRLEMQNILAEARCSAPDLTKARMPVAPVDGEETDSIYAKNVSGLSSSGAAPVASRPQTVKKDQVLSGSRWAAPAVLAAA